MTDCADNPITESGVIGVGKQDDVRGSRRRQVEQLVASGMGVDQWCRLNKVSKAALYYWMSAFKESDPDIFGGYEIAHAGDGKRNWYEHVRRALKASTAIERAEASGVLANAADPPAFAVVDVASLAGAEEGSAGAAATAPITVRMRGIEVDVPAGCARQDIAAVLQAVASL